MNETIQPQPENQPDETRLLNSKEKDELALLECSFVWHNIASHRPNDVNLNDEN